MNNERLFVVIAGNIGTGKTTVTRLLSEQFNWKAEFENVSDNPYLEDFYKNMKQWSLPLQLYILTHRFKSHQRINKGSFSAVQDRCIYEDAHIFTRNLFEQGQMDKRDYQTYLTLYHTLCDTLTPPDLIVYLRKSVSGLKKQIDLRGRPYEKTISDGYLASLNRFYDEWVDTYHFGKKLIIESEDLDFIRRSSDFNFLVQQIISALDQRDLFFSSNDAPTRLR